MSRETDLAHRLNVIFCALNDSIPGWDPAALADEVAERLVASEAADVPFDPITYGVHECVFRCQDCGEIRA